MEYNYKVLKSKIEDYFSYKTTKNELVEWLKLVYSEFLIKGFLELENLCSYPLLMRLLIAFEDDNNEENVKRKFWNNELNYIYRILCGCEDKSLFYRMSLPWKYGSTMNSYNSIYSCYLQFKKTIKEYMSGKMENYNEIKQQINILNQGKNAKDILSLLKIKILSLAEQIFSDIENEIIEENIPYLYPKINFNRTDNRLLSLLFDYLDCILGEKIIMVEVTYLNGMPQINIHCDYYG